MRDTMAIFRYRHTDIPLPCKVVGIFKGAFIWQFKQDQRILGADVFKRGSCIIPISKAKHYK